MTRSTLNQLNQQKISDRVKLAAYNALVIFEDGPFKQLRISLPGKLPPLSKQPDRMITRLPRY